MLWTLVVILLILWLVGAFVRPFGGNLIHLLLVIILIIVLIQLLTGRDVAAKESDEVLALRPGVQLISS